MNALNPSSERLKRNYLQYLKEARGKSEATPDNVRESKGQSCKTEGATPASPA
jgi:hypothetical protein